MNEMTPQDDQPDWLKEMLREMPWHGPREWARYRCRSCDHADWIEDIIVDADECHVIPEARAITLSPS